MPAEAAREWDDGSDTQAAGSQAKSPPQIACGRCGTKNALGMRFCKDCGLRLSPDAPTPYQVSPEAPPAVAPPPTCSRCRGVGDVGAVFCKFCGSPYKDALQVAGSSSSGHARAVQVVAPPPGSQVAWNQQISGPTPRPGTSGAILVAVLKDGTDGPNYSLNEEQTDIGRLEGDIILADDPYLSPRHLRIKRRGDAFVLRDLESVNGTYFRLRDAIELVDSDVLLVGQQVMKFELIDDGEAPIGPGMQQGVLLFGTPEAPRLARLVQITTEGIGRDVFHLYRDETVLGRENGDIVFSDDPFMSRRHASITLDRASKRVTLRDLGSSNGTSIRLRSERVLVHGDQFRAGRHLFRFDSRNVMRGGR